MKITKIQQQIKHKERYSIYVDEKYAFSLHEYQLANLGLRTGQEVTPQEVQSFAKESQFGKAYERALHYVMIRPRSEKEVKEYLTRTFLYPKPKVFTDTHGVRHLKKQKVDTAEVSEMITRVMDRLRSKGYINDTVFAKAWVASRYQLKKTSQRKLKQELLAKGVTEEIIATVMQNSEDRERQNLEELVAKKQRLSRYQDPMKLAQYLMRQGFLYNDIKEVLDL